MEPMQNIVAVYAFQRHVDEDGRPSRRDGSYQEQTIYLYANRSFRLVEQRGRLEPRYEVKTGDWAVAEEQLTLSINARQFPDGRGTMQTEEHFAKMRLKQADRLGLTDGYETWKRTEGLLPAQLFAR